MSGEANFISSLSLQATIHTPYSYVQGDLHLL